MYEKILLAPLASTGNITGTATDVNGGETVAFTFDVSAIGATPTVTYKYQGSADGVTFYNLAYVTDATDTLSVATRTATTVSQQIAFVSNPVARRYRYFRVVTTANTNVTYSASAYRISA